MLFTLELIGHAQVRPNPAFGGSQEYGNGLLSCVGDSALEPAWVPLSEHLASVPKGPQVIAAEHFYSNLNVSVQGDPIAEAQLWAAVPKDQLELVVQRTAAWHGLRRQFKVTGSSAGHLLLCACAPARKRFGELKKVIKMPRYRKGKSLLHPLDWPADLVVDQA